jgi:hypothetical protein
LNVFNSRLRLNGLAVKQNLNTFNLGDENILRENVLMAGKSCIGLYRAIGGTPACRRLSCSILCAIDETSWVTRPCGALSIVTRQMWPRYYSPEGLFRIQRGARAESLLLR